MGSILDGFEEVTFPQKTAMRLYRDRIAINTAYWRAIGNPECAKPLINWAQKKVAFIPSDTKDENGMPVIAQSLHSLCLCDTLLKLTGHKDYPVEIQGKAYKADKCLIFDLTTAKSTEIKTGRGHRK